VITGATVAAQLAWAKRNVIDRLPEGRFKSLARTHLELVLFYAVASARGEDDLFELREGEPEEAPKPPISGALKARTYDLLQEAVSAGVRAGLQHANKHTTRPTRDAIAEHLERDVMAAIFERFDTE